MVYSTPIKKNLWTNKIQDYADIQLFICHLMLDLKLFFSDEYSFLNCVTPDNKPVFNSKGAAEYEKLMTKCYSIYSMSYEDTVIDIWPELVKWLSEESDGSAKSMQVRILSTDKLMYIAEFKSDFPLISIIYSVDTSNGNNKKKRVGYGTIIDTDVADMDWSNLIGDFEYRIYDNEAKKHFTGVIGKDADNNFIIWFELNSSKPETLRKISK